MSVAVALGLVPVAATAGLALVFARATRPSALNYRGARLPLLLGAAGAAGSGVGVIVFWATPAGGMTATGLRIALAALIVLLAGVVDDLAPHGPRGLRGHLRALASGSLSTGILKLFVAVAASVVVVTVLPRRSLPVELAGVVVLAGATNLWNGLDVAPGRAIKAFVVVTGCALLAGVRIAEAPTIPAVFAAALALFPFDVRERAMIGDGGSNLLGVTAGLGLYLALPAWGLGVAAAALVGLNIAADTITLSRLIGAVPPLRWVDGLGRLRPGVGA
jgi:UDP-GlcNAc:undecaprenyl-phosphate GlcNAc-1-phosphate transferase